MKKVVRLPIPQDDVSFVSQTSITSRYSSSPANKLKLSLKILNEMISDYSSGKSRLGMKYPQLCFFVNVAHLIYTVQENQIKSEIRLQHDFFKLMKIEEESSNGNGETSNEMTPLDKFKSPGRVINYSYKQEKDEKVKEQTQLMVIASNLEIEKACLRIVQLSNKCLQNQFREFVCKVRTGRAKRQKQYTQNIHVFRKILQVKLFAKMLQNRVNKAKIITFQELYDEHYFFKNSFLKKKYGLNILEKLFGSVQLSQKEEGMYELKNIVDPFEQTVINAGLSQIKNPSTHREKVAIRFSGATWMFHILEKTELIQKHQGMRFIRAHNSGEEEQKKQDTKKKKKVLKKELSDVSTPFNRSVTRHITRKQVDLKYLSENEVLSKCWGVFSLIDSIYQKAIELIIPKEKKSKFSSESQEYDKIKANRRRASRAIQFQGDFGQLLKVYDISSQSEKIKKSVHGYMSMKLELSKQENQNFARIIKHRRRESADMKEAERSAPKQKSKFTFYAILVGCLVGCCLVFMTFKFFV